MRAIFLKERGGLNGFSIFATRRNGSPFPPSLSLSLSLDRDAHSSRLLFKGEARVHVHAVHPARPPPPLAHPNPDYGNT